MNKIFLIISSLLIISCRSNSCIEKVIPRKDEKVEISCAEGQYIDVRSSFVLCKCQPF